MADEFMVGYKNIQTGVEGTQAAVRQLGQHLDTMDAAASQLRPHWDASAKASYDVRFARMKENHSEIAQICRTFGLNIGDFGSSTAQLDRTLAQGYDT